MSNRTVTDAAGRTWTCTTESTTAEGAEGAQGRDVALSCVTESVSEPVRLTVGWQWEKMAEPGLARLISQKSPAPKR